MIDLEELYDPTTITAIDASPSRRARLTVGGARGSTMAGAILLAGLTGGREAMEEIRPAVAEVRPEAGLDTYDAVTVLFVPGVPAATVAVVRPWRLAGFPTDTGIPGGVTPSS